jgi:hypothetical protein
MNILKCIKKKFKKNMNFIYENLNLMGLIDLIGLLKEFHWCSTVIPNFLVNINHTLLNNLFINNLFDLFYIFDFNNNSFILIIDSLVVTIVIGIIILAARGFGRGLKDAANIAIILAAGATMAASGSGRVDSEDKRKKEEEERTKQEAAEEERKQQQAAAEAPKIEEEKAKAKKS